MARLCDRSFAALFPFIAARRDRGDRAPGREPRAYPDRARLLSAEREALIAERARAVRQHRAVSLIDARLQVVTTELLRGGR